MSSSSSSSLNLSKMEDEPNMNNGPIAPDLSCTLTKKYCQQYKDRFFFVGESDEGEHHFLEWCFLCQQSISSSDEIFMYRGDEAFCSEKCRTEQMEMDEALETIERRQRLITKSTVSFEVGNYSVRNSSEDKQQDKSVFRIQKRPTIANLTACGLISLQNSGLATNATFMEP